MPSSPPIVPCRWLRNRGWDHVGYQRRRQVFIKKKSHAGFMLRSATEFQWLPWAAWGWTHPSVNRSEGQIKVAETRVILSNLRLADSLTEQACDVFEWYTGPLEDTFATEYFGIGDNPTGPLAIQIHILHQLLTQGMIVDRHGQFTFLHQEIGPAHLPSPHQYALRYTPVLGALCEVPWGTVTSFRKQRGDCRCAAGKLLKGRFRGKMNWVEKR